jgi:hypothetical protein
LVTSRSTFTLLFCGRAPVVTPTLIRSLIARVAPIWAVPVAALVEMSRLSTPSVLRSRSKASPLPERVATARVI